MLWSLQEGIPADVKHFRSWKKLQELITHTCYPHLSIPCTTFSTVWPVTRNKLEYKQEIQTDNIFLKIRNVKWNTIHQVRSEKCGMIWDLLFLKRHCTYFIRTSVSIQYLIVICIHVKLGINWNPVSLSLKLLQS